jgi:hypothetical protein
MKVTEGSKVEIKCDVHGLPFPEITWTPKPSSLGSKYRVNGTTITLMNASINDSSIFYCKAKSALGESSKQIVLEVFSTYCNTISL